MAVTAKTPTRRKLQAEANANAAPQVGMLGSVVVGRIERFSADGEVWVDYPGNPGGPVAARTVVDWPADAAPSKCADVLLNFDGGDPRLPIVVGFVRDRLRTTPPRSHGEVSARLDGNIVVLEAEREIQLRCGKSSISLTQDGRITVRGANLTSRSSGPHKIQGATVNIN